MTLFPCTAVVVDQMSSWAESTKRKERKQSELFLALSIKSIHLVENTGGV